jgi:patatin-related protein
MEETRMSRAIENSGSVREVRIALVCYGGVSLAIYMHGVTRELHRLVLASSRFDEDANPFEPPCSEHVYWELLHELAERDGVRTRVVVDVISGTSAGGINGVFLAKAIAHDLSQQSLRDLWFEEADIGKLLSGPRLLDPLGVKGKLAWFVVRALLARGRVSPPLRGDRMCQLLYRALAAMAPDARPAATAAGHGADREGLLPPDSSLELFVTMTDARGHRRYLPIGNRRLGDEPLVVSDLTHRHVVRFAVDRRRGEDHFAGGVSDAALAFSARATSCFPGAFPPVSLAGFMQDIGRPNSADLPMIEREFFRAYQLARQGPRHTYFIDGGVLDNFPFAHAIEAITRKPAASEVKRWLVYIEPDPSRASSEPQGSAPAETALPRPPGWADTILAGLSSIPRKEPIIDDLVRVRAFNERVAYIADLTQTNYPQIEKALHETDQDLRGGELSEANVGRVMTAMNQRARQRLGSGYAAYVRLKLQGIANDVADIVARAYAYPPDSGQASFARAVMLATIAHRFPAEGEMTDALIRFLRTFDLAFTDRRLRFVIQGVNDAYRQDNFRLGPLDPDRRQQLDLVKAELYARLEELWEVVSPTSVQAGVGPEPLGLFDEEQLAEPVRREVSPQQFAEEHRVPLDGLLERLGAYLDDALKPFPGRLWELFVAVTGGWPELQQLLLVRFLGFPVWDTLILPIVELTEIRQLRPIDIVRISPRDGRPGRLPPKQLKGAAVHHFGAFFDRPAREHDFLWGRLDGAEQLLNLVAPDLDERWRRAAFQAVLEEEGPQLPGIQPVIQEIRGTLAAADDPAGPG